MKKRESSTLSSALGSAWSRARRTWALRVASGLACGLLAWAVEAAPLKACLMPSYRQALTYANAVINEPITVWGRCWDGAGPFTYTFDFGDGTTASGAVSSPRYIGVAHTYTMAGKKTVTLTVAGGGETKTCETIIRVFVAPTFDIRVNQAIEKGLLWSYLNQVAVDASTVKWVDNSGAPYDLTATGFALLAFEENGHLASFNFEDDIYAETVKKGLNYLFGCATRSAISVQTSGNPDSNGNGVGAYLNENAYANGAACASLVMAAQSASVASNFVVYSGAYAGSSLVTLVQDLMDQYGYCQGDGGNLGGWVYSMNTSDNGRFDGSVQQWPCLFFAVAKDRWNISPNAWVIANAVRGFKTIQNANGGCGYSSNSSYVNGAKTGGLLVGYKLGDKGREDADAARGISYLGSAWNANHSGGVSGTAWAGDFYAMYGIKKGLHVQDVATVVTSTGARKWYEDISTWLLGFREGGAEAAAGMPFLPTALSANVPRTAQYGFGQNADGSWTSGHGYMPTSKAVGTPLGVLMLTKVVTEMGPIAVIAPVTPQAVPLPPARPDPLPFLMDGRGSYHQDRTKSIIHYLWDFDASDGLNWNNPDARGSKPANPGYRAKGRYTVTLCVTDDSNPAKTNLTTAVVVVTDEDVAPIAVPIPPELPAYGGFPNEPILLDGSESFDPNGDPITNYVWDINGNGVYGDGNDVSSTSPTATVTLTSEFIGDISLQVTANGKSGDSSLSVTDLYCTPTDVAVGAFQIAEFVKDNFADIRVVFTNRPTSKADYNNVLVRFFDGDPLRGGVQISTNLTVNLPRGVPVPLNTRLVRLYGVEPQHIHVYVDADNQIMEGNELNNVVRYKDPIPSVVFGEDFEDGNSIPPGWTQVSEVNTYKWQVRTGGNNAEPPAANSGVYNLYYQAQTTNDNRTKLVSPPLYFAPAALDPTLRFWQCMVANSSHLPYGQDELRVYYRTAEEGAWKLLAEYTDEVTNWVERVIRLPEVSQTYYLAFEGVTRWGRGVCVDDIVVTADMPPDFVTITTANPLPSATAKAEYGYRLRATGGGGAYTWSVVSNSLPKGLGLEASTGVITGMPAAVGSAVFRVRAAASLSNFDEATFSLAVQAAVTVSGKVTRDSTAAGVPGLTLVLSGGGGRVVTDASGNYTAAVRKGWTGTVTPVATADMSEIVPESRSYTNLQSNVTSQNYACWSNSASIPLAVYAQLAENRQFDYKVNAGYWNYYYASGDIRNPSPAPGGSAEFQVKVTGPGLLAFTYELFGADGTNKIVCQAGSRSCPARLAAGPAAVTVALPAGVQTVKWRVTRGPKSPEAVASVKDIVWHPLGKVTSPTPGDGASLSRAEFAGLGWAGGCDFCRVYSGLAASSLSLVNTNRYAGGAVPAADLAGRLDAARGKTIFWRADAVRVDSFGAEAVNAGSVWSFTAVVDGAPRFSPAPAPADTMLKLTRGVKYEIGPYPFTCALPGTVSAAVKSGALPPGVTAAIKNGALVLSGVPKTSGSHSPVIQLSVKNGTVVTLGDCVAFDITVSPQLSRVVGTYDGWVDGPVLGQGTFSLTVSAEGVITGKSNLLGTNYTLNASSFSGETNDVNGATYLYAQAELKYGTRLHSPARISIWLDGRIAVELPRDPTATVTLFRNNWKEPGMPQILAGYLGYYTVALPTTNQVPAEVAPLGSGYVALTISAGGAVKAAGVLADGNAFSYSATMLYEPTNAATGADARALVVLYTAPSSYKGRGALFGVLEVAQGPEWELNKRNVVLEAVPVRWWNASPKITALDLGGFRLRLLPSGGYYNKAEVLSQFYAGRALAISASDLPEDWDGFNNSADTGFTFLSGPEDVGLTPTATGFTVQPKVLVKVPGTALVDLDQSTNPWGLSLILNKATGEFNGSFMAFYESEGAAVQKTKTVSYKGLLTPVRAKLVEEEEEPVETEAFGVEGRGYYLVPDKCYYREGAVLKYYPFNWSYDVRIDSVLTP